MDYTSRMVALLRELRRERNGAVADSMRYYGTPYGLNYGVSLPTLRRIARAEAPDHGFARYLYRQDVRELRLAALHIACPACLTPEEFPAWAAGIVNSEIAEEAAFALLSRAEAFPALFSAWIASPDALLQYAALLAAARSPRLTASWRVKIYAFFFADRADLRDWLNASNLIICIHNCYKTCIRTDGCLNFL